MMNKTSRDLSRLLNDDENCFFDFDHLNKPKSNDNSSLRDKLVEDIDQYLLDRSTFRSPMHYSRQKQLAFDRVEVDYQRLVIVGHSH